MKQANGANQRPRAVLFAIFHAGARGSHCCISGPTSVLSCRSLDDLYVSRLLVKARAAAGDVEGIKWLVTQPGCVLIEVCAEKAAEHGHLEVLKALRAGPRPCPWGPGVYLTVTLRLHVHHWTCLAVQMVHQCTD